MNISNRLRDHRNDKRRSHIPFRLNLLFLIVFISFSLLIIRLSYLQIVKGTEFTALVERTETTESSISVPRGLIYDAKGRVMVGNEPKLSIIYTRAMDHSPAKIAGIAKDLAQLITVDIKGLTKRDLKDYWAATHETELQKRTPASFNRLTGSKLYLEQLKLVKDKDILYSDKEKNVIAIFKKMAAAYSLSTVTVKNDGVTNEEVALVNERLSRLDGVNVATDWTRRYPEGNLLRTLLGNVTQESTGLPRDKMKEYLNKGYSLNDRIGNSYIEEQYESVLSGTKKKIINTTSNTQDVVDQKEVYQGKKGDNLVLSIDMNFQKRVEEITEETLRQLPKPLADRAYIVAMNPKNGDLLAVAGKRMAREGEESENGIVDDALGAINSSFGMGSSIKAATVLAAYMDGVITPDKNTITDEAIVFQGSKPKTSVFNRDGGKIPLTDIQALERSSNVYMMRLAMMMGGQSNYEPGGLLDINPTVFDKLRNYYAQFGLGVKTGVDLPMESTGFKGVSRETFYALDFSYGQYDLYTPLQLASYMSTIANDGVRVSPRFVRSIRGTDKNGNLGALETPVAPTVMNHIQCSKAIIEHVQNGLYQVTHGANGTANEFAAFNIPVAGKTGTAEAFYDGPIEAEKGRNVINSTFVGYAPYNNPEIVVAVVLPYQNASGEDVLAKKVALRVFDLYFNKRWDQTGEDTPNPLETPQPNQVNGRGEDNLNPSLTNGSNPSTNQTNGQ